MEGAQLMAFENCCRIHTCIPIEKMTEYLDLDPQDAGSRIVQLIRESNVNANIDAEKKQIKVSANQASAYEVVKTFTKQKNLDNRSNQLIEMVEKKFMLRDNDGRD